MIRKFAGEGNPGLGWLGLIFWPAWRYLGCLGADVCDGTDTKNATER